MISKEEWELRRTLLLAKMTDAERLAYSIFIKLQVPVCIQFVLPPYIVDFLGMDRNFILELDGSAHDGRDVQDDKRSQTLWEGGFNIYRLENKDVNKENIERYIDMSPKIGLEGIKNLITNYNNKRGETYGNEITLARTYYHNGI